ncbi:MAG: hypothetical protein JEZ11_00805 [Desulfobacterales bacterium]|nr:hypothetical protein [Desulfobacterales bacterium]
MDCNDLERRCPRLGGPVAFGYCRKCGDDGKPCFKILDCWWERFDVAAVMTAQMGTAGVEELRRSRPQPKVTSLLDLIAQAKERIDGP